METTLMALKEMKQLQENKRLMAHANEELVPSFRKK